jgi:predicted amidohydrolase YtcJ
MPDKQTVFTNGRIHTMDPLYAHATALAVQGEKVVAVGADDEVLALVRPGDERIDLRGRTMLPGLTDAHVHLHGYAQAKRKLDLFGVASLDEVLTRVAAWAEKQPAGQWVLGRSWNQNLWPEPVFPTAADLDRVVPERPVYLVAQSGHAGWANSLALKLAGVTQQRSDPRGGQIRRDAEGRPTGILLEEAMKMATEVIPEPSPAVAAEVIRDALPDLWEVGITGVHCMDGGAAFAGLQVLHQQRALKLRVLKYLPLERLDYAVGIGLRSGFGDDWLRVGGIKLFVDGALGVRTAMLYEPYEGEPDNYGIPILDQAELMEIGRKASQTGLSLAVHAIGDRANRMALDFLEMFPTSGPIPHRIEHVQLLHPADLTRLAVQDVTASVQPVHAPSDMQMAERHWGERTRYAYAFRTLLENGTRLAFGSDAPVEPLAPLLGIHAAVTRRRLDGAPGPDGWHPEQRLSAHQAVLGFTVGPAQAAGCAHRTGGLAPGKLADLIVLDRDLFEVDPMEIPEARVLGTMVGGEWVRSLEI